MSFFDCVTIAFCPVIVVNSFTALSISFLSATAFAAANGILPYGNVKDVKAAWQALQVGGPFGTRKLNAFYQELLRRGVVNSQVQR